MSEQNATKPDLVETSNAPVLYTSTQVAGILQLNRGHVLRLIRGGKIDAVRVGPHGSYRVTKASLEAFLGLKRTRR